MDWSPVIGLAGNIASGIMGMHNASDAADKAFHRQKELMLAQNQYNVDNYRHRYQWSVYDMRAAGLNPILAATQGISGNVSGVGLPSAPQAALPPTPDFAGTFNSARQISSQKEIAKMQNDVAKEEIRLREIDINSAKEKRDQDMILDRGRFDLEKMVQEASVRRADELNSATIQNMKDRLQAEIEHWERSDMSAAAMASAALASANAAGLQAEVARELGISKSAVMDAERAYIGLQSDLAEENLHWQKWLNRHQETRGAVGFIGSFLDTAGLAKRSVGSLYSGAKSIGIGSDW